MKLPGEKIGETETPVANQQGIWTDGTMFYQVREDGEIINVFRSLDQFARAQRLLA